ncbi:11376_t:CDS:2 [Gigaspora rosea]|nr:11376_t:CDS:2 [Gigaspora rosea]
MLTSNEATNVGIVSRTETCTCCGKLKPIAEFTRMSGSRIDNSTQPFILNDDIQLLPLDENIQLLLLNKDYSVDVDSVENSSDDLLYNIHDIEELINIKFEDS